MQSFPTKLKALCSPAYVYFIFSIIFLVLMLLQNLSDTTSYTVGNFSCSVPSTILIFVAKFVYILFWTWILNLMCKDGHTEIAWLLVLIPFILFFIIIGVFLIYM
jgi:hypothetical protein